MKSNYEELRKKIYIAHSQWPLNTTWQHFKGDVYKIEGYSFDTENEEIRIQYKIIDGPSYNAHEEQIIWSRPSSEWDEIADHRTGAKRFERVRQIQVWQKVNASN